MSDLNRAKPTKTRDEHAVVLGVISPFSGGQQIDLDYYFAQDYTDITLAAQELPAIIEWINSELQAMYEDKLNLETEAAEARAKAYFALKSSQYFSEYGTKPTEKGLEYAIDLNDEVQDVQRRLNIAKGWVRRLAGTMDSFQTKLDLIRSSEATRRRLVEPVELELDREAARLRRERSETKD